MPYPARWCGGADRALLWRGGRYAANAVARIERQRNPGNNSSVSRCPTEATAPLCDQQTQRGEQLEIMLDTLAGDFDPRRRSGAAIEVGAILAVQFCL